jgi:ADP-heptose:LPS heptosyltransferase
MNPLSEKENASNGARNERAALGILGRIRGGRLLILRSLEALTRPLAWLSTSKMGGVDPVNRILVFAPGQLGDIMMITPFLRGLRSRYPRAHIAVLGNLKLKSLLLDQNLADELIPVRVPWAEYSSRWRMYNPFGSLWPDFVHTLLSIRQRQFDLSFMTGFCDLRHNLSLWLAGAKRRVAFAYAGGASLVTDVVQPDLARPHYADLCLQLLASLGGNAGRDDMYVHVPPEDRESAERFLSEHGVSQHDLVIGIHPGARLAVRQWGEERFREVADRVIRRFGAKVLWFSDPAQAAINDPGAEIIHVSLPLRQFLAVVAHCRLLVCNDSGPMHMAAGLAVPVVAVFGPTQPEWFGPLGHGHRIVIRGDVWCRPCSDRCIFEEPYCLKLITVDQVMDAVIEAMGDGLLREKKGCELTS